MDRNNCLSQTGDERRGQVLLTRAIGFPQQIQWTKMTTYLESALAELSKPGIPDRRCDRAHSPARRCPQVVISYAGWAGGSAVICNMAQDNASGRGLRRVSKAFKQGVAPHLHTHLQQTFHALSRRTDGVGSENRRELP